MLLMIDLIIGLVRLMSKMDEKEKIVCPWCGKSFRYMIPIKDLGRTSDGKERMIGSTEPPEEYDICVKCFFGIIRSYLHITEPKIWIDES